MSAATDTIPVPGMATNVRLYPLFRLLQNMIFWLAVWFLFFQDRLSAADALVLYAILDLTTTVLEVPSGYVSDRLGRRWTLIASSLAPTAAMFCFFYGDSFAAFALGQVLLGVGSALVSGTDSAFLYESLETDGRQAEVELHEVRAWRATFAGFGISAAIGGAVATVSLEAVFALTGMAMAASALVASLFTEPPRTEDSRKMTETMRFKQLREAFSNRVLIWLLILSALLWAYGHIPFVFGQPFILDSLSTIGFDGEAPLVSGLVTTAMMAISVGTSMFAPALRRRVGLAGLVCFAFFMQIALAAVLAATNAPLAIAVLLLRMVPGSLSAPFIVARIQPLLSVESRATFLSLRSLFGRGLLVISAWLASLGVASEGAMNHAELQFVLVWVVGIGIACLLSLIVWARRLPINDG
ncbi:MAG: MFS transporter [Pseudomonadota bacterium]